MDAQQLGDRRRRPPAPAALGGHAEAGDEASRGLHPAPRALDAVRVVDEPQIELGLRPQAQLGQRRVVPLVVAIARHRQVNPVERAAQAGRQRVGDLHEAAGVGGLLEVAVLHVAVAEVIAELDVGRYVARYSQQPLEDAALDVGEPHREHAFQHRELEVGVPLDRELVVRHLAQHERQLFQQPRLVRRLQRGLVLGHDERADRRQRGGQAHLEAAGRRHLAVALEPREDAIRRQRRVRVAERGEADLVAARAVLQPYARQRPPALRAGRHHLELRLRGEDGKLPHDPVRARPRLAVGDAPHAIAELGGHGGEDGLRAGQRHAADEMSAVRRRVGRGRHGATILPP